MYLPAVNGILFVGVFALVAAFGLSERLASAYGLAVTGTLPLSASLFLIFARTVWKWSLARVITMAVLVGGLELAIFLANTSKILSGCRIPRRLRPRRPLHIHVGKGRQDNVRSTP